MFGYIVTNKPELRVREYDRYSEFYCGLCHSLKRHGETGRLALSYDFTFLAMLLAGLYEPELKEGAGICVMSPLKKKKYFSGEIFDYSADMDALLMYYKCLDDWQDEKKVQKGLYAEILKPAMADIRRKYPDKCRKVDELLKKNNLAEKKFAGKKLSPKALDYLSGLTGQMLSETFAMKDDEWNDELRGMGFYLGKFVYISDAYCDLKEDIKKGQFNPLISFMDRPDFEDWVHSLLIMSASEAARYFEMLPVIQDAEILRNIIYAGIWNGYATAKKGRQGDNE